MAQTLLDDGAVPHLGKRPWPGTAGYRAFRWAVELPAGAMGDVARHIAAADLMGEGWQVYVPASKPLCEYDLLAVRGAVVLRLWVRVGRQSGTGRVYWSVPAGGDADGFVVVWEDGLVYARPDKAVVDGPDDLGDGGVA